MNKDFLKAKSHAELVVADLLRRTLNIYEHELATATACSEDKSTDDKFDNGDCVLTNEENKRSKDDHIEGAVINELQQQQKEGFAENDSDSLENTSAESDRKNDASIDIIEKMTAETTRVNDTLKLFNRKHRLLPSIPETDCEDK